MIPLTYMWYFESDWGRSSKFQRSIGPLERKIFFITNSWKMDLDLCNYRPLSRSSVLPPASISANCPIPEWYRSQFTRDSHRKWELSHICTNRFNLATFLVTVLSQDLNSIDIYQSIFCIQWFQHENWKSQI